MHKDRVLLEQTIGKLVLARLNGKKVGSAAQIYTKLGGKDLITIDTLKGAFGSSYTEHAEKGFAHVSDSVKTAYKKALEGAGQKGPKGAHFKDLQFHK